MSSDVLHVHAPAIYASLFPDEHTSPAEQVERCLKQAAVYGWTISPQQIYVDAGHSGYTLNRPAMTRLRRAVAAGEVDCILVHRLDRISLSIGETVNLVLEEWSRQHNAVLRSVTEEFSTNCPVGGRVLSVLSSFAHATRTEMHQRLENGRRRSFARGARAVGEPPIGYVRGEISGTMVVEPRQADLVRQIFRLYVQGHGFMKIAGLLNADGHRTAGGRRWTDKTVRDVTMNEVYIGRVKYGGAYRPGQHQPIIDEAMFAEAQAVRKAREQIGGRSVGSQFLLSGLVRCKGCGHLFYTQPATESKRTGKDGRFYTTQNQAYYQCGGRLKKGSAFCRCGNIQQGLLEAHVVQRLLARFGPTGETPPGARQESDWHGRVSGQLQHWEALPHHIRKQLLQYLINQILVWRTSLGKGRFKEAPQIEVDIVWNRGEKALPEGDLPWVEPAKNPG